MRRMGTRVSLPPMLKATAVSGGAAQIPNGSRLACNAVSGIVYKILIRLAAISAMACRNCARLA
jgi:hypothetical protein